MAVEIKPTPILTGISSIRFKNMIRANSTKSCQLFSTPKNKAFISRILKDQHRGK